MSDFFFFLAALLVVDVGIPLGLDWLRREWILREWDELCDGARCILPKDWRDEDWIVIKKGDGHV